MAKRKSIRRLYFQCVYGFDPESTGHDRVLVDMCIVTGRLWLVPWWRRGVDLVLNHSHTYHWISRDELREALSMRRLSDRQLAMIKHEKGFSE